MKPFSKPRVIRFHPSTKTKSRILNGNEIITGLNINIPNDNKIFETTRSITINGINFQPPVTGEMIMKHFNLKPCKEIGVIKEAIKEAILEGEIPNDYEAAFNLMLRKGNEIGLATNV